MPGEEFTGLRAAGNADPAGIWSDGDTMFVSDSRDGRVYAYSMPTAIDAHLESLRLSGVDIGVFSPDVADYAGAAARSLARMTVTARAAQSAARVVVAPADASRATRGIRPWWATARRSP